MPGSIYRVGLSWYVRQANVAQWINGRAVRNDLHFSTKREALAHVRAGAPRGTCTICGWPRWECPGHWEAE